MVAYDYSVVVFSADALQKCPGRQCWCMPGYYLF